jgi:hypothetical protein
VYSTWNGFFYIIDIYQKEGGGEDFALGHAVLDLSFFADVTLQLDSRCSV